MTNPSISSGPAVEAHGLVKIFGTQGAVDDVSLSQEWGHSRARGCAAAYTSRRLSTVTSV
jgi:hypothetical protein